MNPTLYLYLPVRRRRRRQVAPLVTVVAALSRAPVASPEPGWMMAAKTVGALALLFAHIDTPGSEKLVDAPELRRAIAWGAYLRTHAGRLYAAASMPKTADAATLLAKIQAGRLVDGDGVVLERFTPRLVSSKGWSGLNSTEAVRVAADLLVEYGHLRPDLVWPGQAGGRPSEQYLVNPRCFRGG